MASYSPAKRATAWVGYISLVSQADTKLLKSSPTIAAGDFQVSKDGGALANLTTLPAVTPAASAMVKIDLSATEMTADNVTVVCIDAAGAEWCGFSFNLQPSARQIDDLAYPATSGRSMVVDANGLVDALMVKAGATGAGTAITARDIGASVLLSSGTGTGQIKIASGYVAMTWADIAAPTTAVALTGTTIAVTQKVDVDTIKTNPVVNAGTVTFPTTATLASTTNITAGTITTATNVTTVNGLAANVITAAATAADFGTEVGTAVWATTTRQLTGTQVFDLTGNITGNLSGSVGSVTGAVGSVTGAVGSVTGNVGGNVTGTVGSVVGAVGSVTGNVGGNVVGTVASVVGAVGSVTGLTASNLDATISSRASAANLSTANTNISAIITTLGVAGAGLTALGDVRIGTIASDVYDWFWGKGGGTAAVEAAVWDAVLASHLTAGSTGFGLNAASSAGDPWGTALPGAYGAGTAGKIIGDNINATISSRALASGVILTGAGIDAIWDEVVDGVITGRQAMRLLTASQGGKVSGAATATVTIRDPADTANRIVATVDADGNRSAVTLTL